MGEPVEEVGQGYVSEALEYLEASERSIDEDLENLDEFQSRVQDLDLAFRTGRIDNGESDTEKVLDVYRETFYHGDERPMVQKLDRRLDLSSPAVEFFGELQNFSDVDRETAYSKASFLDGEKIMNPAQVEEVLRYAEAFKSLRRDLEEDVEDAKNSLAHYGREIQDLKDQVLEMNRENPLPVPVHEAAEILEEIEEVEERIDQLRGRRRHELRRREEMYDKFFELNLKRFYAAADFQRPVLEELEALEEDVERARQNLVESV